MASLVKFNGSEIEISNTVPEAQKPKKLGRIAVGIGLKFLLSWGKPLLISFIAMLIREAAKKDSVENVVEAIIKELDSDGDGKID